MQCARFAFVHAHEVYREISPREEKVIPADLALFAPDRDEDDSRSWYCINIASRALQEEKRN